MAIEDPESIDWDEVYRQAEEIAAYLAAHPPKKVEDVEPRAEYL